MERIAINTEIFEVLNKEELSYEERTLIASAEEAASSAYSPYSSFSVGAAVLLDDSTVVKGCNVENASFPSGICAEHNALASAVAEHSGKVPIAIAITAFKKGAITDEPVTPCGKCRQVIAEEELRHSREIKIIMAGKNRTVISVNGCSLLPLYFSAGSFFT